VSARADQYDWFMGRYSVPLAPRSADVAGLDGGQSILDVGCGPGALTAELVRRLGPAADGGHEHRNLPVIKE
jgi:trans-aconitate methyltransferase